MSHLKRTTRIHAPLEAVFSFAHDPRHWSDWYVGISDEKDLDVDKGAGRHRHLMVGTPFPLTQRVTEDHLGRKEGHWRARAESPPERVEVTGDCRLLMLAPEYDWTWAAKNGETEVTAMVDFTVPSEFVDCAEDRSCIERIEAECLQRSLDNLRRLCETEH